MVRGHEKGGGDERSGISSGMILRRGREIWKGVFRRQGRGLNNTLAFTRGYTNSSLSFTYPSLSFTPTYINKAVSFARQ